MIVFAFFVEAMAKSLALHSFRGTRAGGFPQFPLLGRLLVVCLQLRLMFRLFGGWLVE